MTAIDKPQDDQQEAVASWHDVTILDQAVWVVWYPWGIDRVSLSLNRYIEIGRRVMHGQIVPTLVIPRFMWPQDADWEVIKKIANILNRAAMLGERLSEMIQEPGDIRLIRWDVVELDERPVQNNRIMIPGRKVERSGADLALYFPTDRSDVTDVRDLDIQAYLDIQARQEAADGTKGGDKER